MGKTLPENVMLHLSEFVASAMGLQFARERWGDLERGIVAASGGFGFQDVSSCIEWLTTTPLTRRKIEILAGHLTVGETYFFRDRKIFQFLEDEILPPLIHSRRGGSRRLRVWSAGCATGEEAYSVAILLSRLLPDLESWDLTILATDINPRFLDRGREGVYGQWSFREEAAPGVEAHFEKMGEGKLRLVPRIRRMVHFEYLNLAEDSYPSFPTNSHAMDVIFCRNVLMYFAFDAARRAVENLRGSLMDGGWLIVSPSEASHVLFSQFSMVSSAGSMAYRKEACPSSRVVWAPCQEPEELVGLAAIPALPAVLPTAAPGGPSLANPLVESRGNEGSTPYQDALALYDRRRYSETVEILLPHMAEDSADAEGMALLARAYANQGRLQDARSWCEMALAADKLRPEFHYLRATILQEQEDESEAAAALRRALYLDQSFVLAHVALGNLLRRQGALGDARKHFANALLLLRQHPGDATVPESEGMTSGRLAEIIQATA